MALELVRTKGEAEVEKQVAALDVLLRSGNQRALRNPAGFLVTAIRRGFVLSGSGHSANTGGRPKSGEGAATAIAVEASREETKRRGEITSYVEQLSTEEREALEKEALANAQRFTLDGYQRSVKEGRETLAALYRQAIVEKQVARRLAA